MKVIPPLLAVFSLLMMSVTTYAVEDQQWQSYQDLAVQLEQQVKTRPLPELAEMAAKLTRQANLILPSFIKKQPACRAYIQAAIEASENMLNMTLDDIERDYHADGKLPPMKQAVCYHAKDLLVHPATMVVIAKTHADETKTRDMLTAELVEVLAHFNQVKQDAGL